MKTIKTTLLTIVMLLCNISASAHDFEVDGIFYNISSIEELTVEVTSGDNLYRGNIIIPEEVVFKGKTLKVTNIGNSAFHGCSYLTSITIPNSVTNIGNSAFYGCSDLNSITIPNSVTNIGNSAFHGCSYLKSITIPNSVTNIGNSAFHSCDDLTSVTIGNGVRSIGESVFSFCSNLTSITIPNSVTSIGDWAFSSCSRLTVLCFEDGTNTLKLGKGGGYGFVSLFCDCPLETLYLGRNISSIGDTFKRNETLISVTIGDSVTYIKDYTFQYCSNLNSVTIGNSVTSIENFAFDGCTSLNSVTIGNSVTSIENFAFDGCTSLPSITIPNSVTSIGDKAFSRCTNLTSITIGNSVENIGAYALEDCNALAELTITATMPPTVEDGNFDNSDYINMLVKVPEGSLKAYQAADVWRYFWDIQEDASLDIKNTVLDAEDETAPIYNQQGVRMTNTDNLPTGIYIRGGKKFVVK